jgi:hypothetical protein
MHELLQGNIQEEKESVLSITLFIQEKEIEKTYNWSHK